VPYYWLILLKAVDPQELLAGFEMSFAFGDHEDGILDHESVVLLSIFGWHWMTKVLLKSLIVLALIDQTQGV